MYEMPDGPAHLLSFVDPRAWYGIPEIGEEFCVRVSSLEFVDAGCMFVCARTNRIILLVV